MCDNTYMETAQQRHSYAPDRQRAQATVTEVKVKLMDANEKRLGKRTRVYLWPSDWTVLGDFVGRAGLTDDYEGQLRERTRIERALLPEVLRQAELPDQSASFSRKAGCGCGCSPGFVLGQSHGVNVFVKYEVAS